VDNLEHHHQQKKAVTRLSFRPAANFNHPAEGTKTDQRYDDRGDERTFHHQPVEDTFLRRSRRPLQDSGFAWLESQGGIQVQPQQLDRKQREYG
jgi:hypothetical protein